MEPLKACVTGVSGRLGRAIVAELIRRSDTVLVGGMVSSDSTYLDYDIGELAGAGFLGLSTCVALEEAAANADVVIDASAPHVTLAIAERLVEAGGPALATGVTGFSAQQQAALTAASERVALLQASNFSLGVAVVERLIAEAAARLAAEHFDLEITEAHHKHKVDAPSGTALTLGRAAAAARGGDFERLALYERPRTSERRPIGAIGFTAVRGGGVVGEHVARFLADAEEITLGHRAFDRVIFARGAVEAALWLKDRPAGAYSMQDVIG